MQRSAAVRADADLFTRGERQQMREPGSMPISPSATGGLSCDGASMKRQRDPPEARLTMRPLVPRPAGSSWAAPDISYARDVETGPRWRFEGIRQGKARQLSPVPFEPGGLRQFLGAALPGEYAVSSRPCTV